jgi:glycosyltransferase involved in cell wall biosynthesis
MRILTIVRKLSIGGTERAAQDYSIGYKKNNMEVAVLTTHDGGVREKILTEHGIELFIGNSSEQGRYLAVEHALAWNPDLIHIHRPGLADSITGSILRMFKKRSNERVRIIETNVFGYPDYSKDRNLIDIHLLLSRWCYWKWSNWIGNSYPSPIGVIVPNPVETRKFFPEPKENNTQIKLKLGIPENAFIFGRIAQPNPPSWSRIALDAFENIARRMDNIYLILIGLPDRYQKYIKSYPENVRRRIVTLPVVSNDDELRKYYNTFDVFAHSSEMGESFGLVLAESMLCERPVVTLSTPERENSQVELVGHKIGGLVVSNKNSYINAMNLLISDIQLCKHLGKQARERIINNYDISIVMTKLLEVNKILMQSDNRERLRNDLSQKFGTDKINGQFFIKNSLSTIMGKTPVRKKVLMRLVHQPIVYKLLNAIRNC